MSYFSSFGETGSGVEAFDYDISEIVFLDRPSGHVAVALNGVTGGLTSFDVLADGSLDYIMARSFRTGARDFQTVQSTTVSLHGVDFIITGAGTGGEFYAFIIDNNGNMSKVKTLPATLGAPGDIVAIVPFGSDGNIAQIITVTDEGYVQLRSVTQVGESLEGAQTIDLFQADIAHLEVVQNGSDTLIVTTEHMTGDVVSYNYDASTQTTEEVGRSGASVGVGMGTPTDFTTVTVDGVTYVAVVSSISNSLSVFELHPDGALVATDHVLDTLYTLFGQANMVESFEANGNSFVLASGGDAGLSLFTVIPGGQLVLVENFHSSTAQPLMNLSSISVTQSDGVISIHLTSETNAGVTSLQFDANAWSAPQYGSSANGTLTGSGDDDLLIGGAGDEVLKGNNGDDVLSDGGGADTLYGGSGADVFVMTFDGRTDTIADFEAGKDRIDLSDYTMIYSPKQLTYTNLSGGISVWFGDERLDILSSTGYELTIAEVFGTYFINPDRPFLANIGDIMGSSNDDIILGSNLNEFIQGMYGQDTITGGDGDDIILGGEGNDSVWGGVGDDVLYGEQGNDDLYGEDGADEIDGGDGDDIVDGGDGADLIYLGAGNDRFVDNDQTGPEGADTVYGGGGSDRFAGGGGDDTFYGGDGGDRMYGGVGNDTLYGDVGWDRLYGQDGDDALFGGEGQDFLYGGTGNDILSGEEDSDVLTGNEGNDTLHGGDGGDRAYAGEGDDIIYGDAGWDRLYGQDGNDTIDGGEGNDYLYGGNGNDVLSGAAGNDILIAGEGSDRLEGAAGNDTLLGEDGDDTLLGGEGNDAIDGGSGNDTIGGEDGDDDISGGSGSDRIWGGDGNDVISGNDGWDRLYGQEGDDTLNGDAGNDYIYGGTGSDTIRGGDDDDIISGNEQADDLYGDGGTDRMYGGDGDDKIEGGAQRDRLYGQADNDTINGDDGSDFLYGGDGDDDLNGGTGNDFLSGNSGADKFIFQQDFGNDSVQDFNVTEDQVVFDISGANVDDLVLSETSTGTLLISYENGDGLGTVTFNGLSLSDVNDMDIIFI